MEFSIVRQSFVLLRKAITKEDTAQSIVQIKTGISDGNGKNRSEPPNSEGTVLWLYVRTRFHASVPVARKYRKSG